MKHSIAIIISFVLLSVVLQSCDAQRRKVEARTDGENEIKVSDGCIAYIKDVVFAGKQPTLQALMTVPKRAMQIFSKLLSPNNPCTEWVSHLINAVLEILQRLGIDITQIRNMLKMVG